MLRHRLSGLAMVGLLLLANVPRAFATDGHFLHGVGAVNSAMGGAGHYCLGLTPSCAVLDVYVDFFGDQRGLLS